MAGFLYTLHCPVANLLLTARKYISFKACGPSAFAIGNDTVTAASKRHQKLPPTLEIGQNLNADYIKSPKVMYPSRFLRITLRSKNKLGKILLTILSYFRLLVQL